MQKTVLSYLAGSGLILTAMSTASGCELPQWQAEYKVTKYNTTIARLSMSLKAGEKSAQYRLYSKAVGLLAAFSDEEITETSELKQTNDKSWRLIKFSQLRAKDKQREQQFTVQQTDDGLIAEGTAETKPFKLNPSEPIWDRSSVQLAITCDLLTADKPQPAYDYNIIDNGQLLTYHFDYRGPENIRIADKKFDTYTFERISGDRSTKFWLAPTLQFMLVRMEQHKKGKLFLRMTLDLPASEKHEQ